VLAVIVSSFGDFTAAHGFAVNLVAVVVLAGLGVVFCVGAVRADARLARIGVVAGAVFCLADWVLVEDFGFLGGLGTDPNSMIPLILLFTAGWLALTPAPQEAAAAAAAAAPAAAPETAAAGATSPSIPHWLPAPLHPARLKESLAALSVWSVAALGAVAASSAARGCQVTGLTAVALTAAGTPLAATSCARPGVVGIFARTASGWAAAGPAVGGRSGGQPIQVLRLTETSTGNIALLQAGTPTAASVLAAWSSDGTHWTVSPPLPAGSGQVRASGTGAGGTVWLLLAGGRAETVAGPGAAWRPLPTPPGGTAALAAGSAGAFDALAVSGGKLTVFRLSAAGTWRETQALNVPIQYGSSG
jgi:hypothetical protein